MDASTRKELQSYINKEIPTYSHQLSDDEFTPVLLMVIAIKLDNLMAMLEETGPGD
jgi:hypothetical protein